MPFARPNTTVAVIGCGYVGSAIGEALVRAGHDVVGTTTSSERMDDIRASGIKPEQVEVKDVDQLHTVLVDRQAVYLTIAPTKRTRDYRDVYLAGAKNVIAAARGTSIKRIIYTSSTRVYGQDDGGWVDESSPTDPKDAKGRVLREAERALLDGARALSGDAPVFTTVLRLSGIYGPGRDPTSRIQALAGTECTGGDAYVNLIHRDDVVAASVALLDKSHHGVLNLSDDQPEPRRVFYDRVVAEAGLPPIRWVHDEATTKLGKRIHNGLIKRTLALTLQYPTHGRA